MSYFKLKPKGVLNSRIGSSVGILEKSGILKTIEHLTSALSKEDCSAHNSNSSTVIMSSWPLLYMCLLLQLLDVIIPVGSKCFQTLRRDALCQPPWLAFHENCYLLVTERKSYQTAEQHCQSYSKQGRPAHLASILSEKENNVSFQYAASVIGINRNVWIGYNDLAEEGNYTWLDGSPPGYENWWPGFPVGDAHGNQDCIHLYGGEAWKELLCTSLKFSLCKMQGAALVDACHK